ncbi:ribonuclease HI family protein [Candidatus Wolfebacteria bacterium]|nr:ribonuclease HI family protein [Candidatus Wolfebacteria bacterium]
MAGYVINTDGGARGNPGPAGAGWVIVDEKGRELKKNAKALGVQTNNWAEYEAVILALAELKRILGTARLRDASVEVRMDSELVARQLRGEYQVKEEPLQLQFVRVHNMQVKDFPNITFTYVPREKNKEADKLANTAMDGHSGDLFEKHT